MDVTPYKSSFVKLIVEEKRKYSQFDSFIDRLYREGVHDVKIIETLLDADIDEDADIDVKDTLTLLNEYIDEVDVSVDKSDLKKLMQTLYIESCEVT